MFLGNDFGTREGFQKLNLHENPPTWRHIRHRLKLAGIPGQLGFYTNAYLGLRTDRSALADPIQHGRYDELCAGFLAFQVSTQAPRLIVILGDRPAGLLRRVMPFPHAPAGSLSHGTHDGHSIGVLIMSHPYSDLGKTEAQKQEEGNFLRLACSGLGLV